MAPLGSKSPFIIGKKIGRNVRDFRQILREKKSTFGRGEAGAFVTDFRIKITDQIHT